MRGAVLTLAVVAACCAVATSIPTIGIFGVGPAIAAKFLLAILGGYGHHGHHGKHFGIGKRSVKEEPTSVEKELVLSSLAQLDPSGCLMKLLCHLEAKDADELTRHETILAGMFEEATDSVTVTPSSAAFTYALGVGSKSRDAAVCDKIFSKCPLKYSQLSSVLEESWECPIGGSLLN